MAAAPPAPMNLTIPLPPGMTPAQFQSLQGSVVTIAICVAVAASIVFWDYVNLLPDEIALYRTVGRKIFKSPSAMGFIILRISGVLATLPALWFTSLQSNHCQSAVVASQIGVVFVVASSGVIFLCRVFAIWGRNRVVQAVAGLMFTLMMTCWIAVAVQYKATNGPPTSFGSNCSMQPIASWSPISYASSVAFDFTILILTLLKLGESRNNARDTIGFLVYRDSLLYFIATAVTNLVVLAIQAQGEDFALIKPTAVPFSTLLTTTMGARVFLNLKLFMRRKEKAAGNIPWSSQSYPRTGPSISNNKSGMSSNTGAGFPALTFSDPVSTFPPALTFNQPEGTPAERMVQDLGGKRNAYEHNSHAQIALIPVRRSERDDD